MNTANTIEREPTTTTSWIFRVWPIITGAGAMAAFACGSWWLAGVLAWWWIWAEITPDWDDED